MSLLENIQKHGMNCTDMEALGAFMSDPAEIQWDKDNGAVYKAYMMSEMTE